MEKYLTPNEVAEMLKVTRTTVGRWIKEKKIIYIQIDKAIRIPASQFEK